MRNATWGSYHNDFAGSSPKQDGTGLSQERILASCLRRPSICSGTAFTCGDRQMVGSTSAPIQRAGRLGGHSHMASRSVCWLAGSKAWRGIPGADHDDYRTIIYGPVRTSALRSAGSSIRLFIGASSEPPLETGLIFSLVLTALPGIWAVMPGASHSTQARSLTDLPIPRADRGPGA